MRGALPQDAGGHADQEECRGADEKRPAPPRCRLGGRHGVGEEPIGQSVGDFDPRVLGQQRIEAPRFPQRGLARGAPGEVCVERVRCAGFAIEETRENAVVFGAWAHGARCLPMRCMTFCRAASTSMRAAAVEPPRTPAIAL